MTTETFRVIRALAVILNAVVIVLTVREWMLGSPELFGHDFKTGLTVTRIVAPVLAVLAIAGRPNK